MAQYFGFDPGTYQPWALNLTQNALGQPGVVRGFSVTPASPASMNVVLTIDPVALDGVLFLGNGAWCRIDAATSLAVPSNTSGTTRQDAVLVQMDPTGVNVSQIVYQANWTTGFASQSYAGSAGNEFVLALVSVPNNAVTITASNIVQTPLLASAGTAPQNYPDSVNGSEAEDNHGSQPGTFVQINQTITAAALNGQTNFSIPLTTMQRLVPQGRIGGALEVGDFAGPNGWYWPKVQGSVSGLIPVANVDPVAGTITTATAAATGETVTISYKYYDFSRDARVHAGATFIPKNSPYLVYQGEVVEDPFGKSMPMWYGDVGAYLLENPGESYYYIDYSNFAEFAQFGGPGSTPNAILSYQNGTQVWNTNGPLATNAMPGQTDRYLWSGLSPAQGNTPNVYKLTLVAGTLYIPGVRSYVGPGLGVVVSGGLVNVQGQDVFLASTSFALPASIGAQQSYTVYTDRYGNISSGLAAPAGMDRVLGRVPLAAAAQFGGQVANSASYGFWGLPNGYLGIPVETAFLSNYTATSPTFTSNGDGWSLVADPLSPNGAYYVTYSSSDVFAATAVCTGMDLLLTTSNNTALVYMWVDQPNITAPATSVVHVAAGSQHNVRVSAFTGLGYGSHTLKVFNATSSSLLGFDSLDIRVPATPAPPAGTYPLAQVTTFGYSATIRLPMTAGVQSGGGNNKAFGILDSFRPDAGPGVWLTNVSDVGYQLVYNAANTGNYTIHYQAGPDKGIISLVGYSIDCYSATYNPDVTSTINAGTALSVSSSFLKNASSLSTVIVINAVEYVPYQNSVTDLRHFSVGRGHASELRGSALLSHQGGRFDDGGVGVRTEQLRDRSLTSRKLAPTYSNVVATTTWSGAPGIDPFISTSITVEVPSTLLVTFGGNPIAATNSQVSLRLVVDGSILATPRPAASGPTTGAGYMALCGAAIVAVPAGTHVLQLYLDNAGLGNQPFYNGTTTLGARYIDAVAFAL